MIICLTVVDAVVVCGVTVICRRGGSRGRRSRMRVRGGIGLDIAHGFAIGSRGGANISVD